MLKDDSIDRFSDYYFRDSFEHSSSESQLIDSNYRGYETMNPSHRSSRSQTPLSHLSSQVDGRICLPNTSQSPSSSRSHHHHHHNTIMNKKSKKFNIVRTFIPTFIIVTILIVIGFILMLETDIGVLVSLKNIPEMTSLRYHFYEPIKQYFRNKLSIFF